MAGRGAKRTHGMSHTRPWVIWTDMKRRCKREHRDSFEHYGAKGVTYDPNWEKFQNFWKDMESGYADDLTLERVDPEKGYSKDNCKWVTQAEQARNKLKYKSNNTGVGGTYIHDNKGVPTLYAAVTDNEGVRRKKGFSLRKYTMELALELASEWLKDKRRLYGYGESHGKEDER